MCPWFRPVLATIWAGAFFPVPRIDVKTISSSSQSHILIKGQSRDSNPGLSDSEVHVLSPYFQFRGRQAGREGGAWAPDSHSRAPGPWPSW